MIRYHHRQFGTVLVVMLVGGAAVAWGVGVAVPRQFPIVWVLPAILLGGAWLFGSLTVTVTETELRWAFGSGLIRKRVPLAEIAAVEVARTSFWEGWGIHRTRRGWLYNVSGFGAVAIRLKSGKQFLVGSDEPEKLAAALRG
jgi:hypothetical protein